MAGNLAQAAGLGTTEDDSLMGERAEPSIGEEKPDFWTWAGAAGEFLGDLVDDVYYVANVVQLFGGRLRYLTMSKAGMAIGGVVGSVSAFSSAYCHFALNYNHQQETHEQGLSQRLVARIFRMACCRSRRPNSLSAWNKAAIAGDFASHTFERAGPLTFAVRFAANDNLSSRSSIITNAIALPFGMATAYANARTCYYNLLKLTGHLAPALAGEYASLDVPENDWASKIAAVGEFLGKLINNAVWVAGIFDLLTSFEVAFAGFSYPGMIMGAGIALLLAVGAAYCGYKVNKANAALERPLPDFGMVESMGIKYYLMLAGSYFSRITDRAAPLSFVANLASGLTLSGRSRAITEGSVILFGALTAVADTRTEYRTLSAASTKRYAVVWAKPGFKEGYGATACHTRVVQNPAHVGKDGFMRPASLEGAESLKSLENGGDDYSVGSRDTADTCSTCG